MPEVVALDLRGSTVALYRGKNYQLLNWWRGWNISPCKAIVPRIDDFLFLQKELKLSVPVVKGNRATVNHVCSIAGKDLAANCIVSRMLSSFERHVH